jgi:hypothetical protein
MKPEKHYDGCKCDVCRWEQNQRLKEAQYEEEYHERRYTEKEITID